MPRVEGRRGRWIAGGIFLLLVLLIVGARLALTPIAARALRKQLNAQPHMHGDFDDLSLSVLRLGADIQGLDLHMNPPGGTPIQATVQAIETHLRWHDLLRLHIVAEAVADHIKATVVIQTPEEMKEMTRQIQHIASMRGLGAELEAQPPFRADRVELRHFEILIADHTEKGVSRESSEIWVHDMEVTLENLADRADLLGGRPTALAVSGKVQRSGAATLFATVDPLADRLDVAAQLKLEHLDLRELYGFIAAKSGLQAQGSIDAFVTMKVHDAQIEGGIKPIVENLHVSPAAANLGPEIEAWFANAGIGAASDRVRGRDALASVIPISGSVENPKVDLWPALVVLLHNAYQAGLPKDFSHEPPAPPGTKPPAGKVGQVADALTKKQFPAVPAPKSTGKGGAGTGGGK
jgi:hypothetical protein